MKAGKIVSIAMFSAYLTACGGGGGNAVRPDPPPATAPPPGTTPPPVTAPPPPGPPSPAPGSSLSEVPEEYRDIVSDEKTISLVIDDEGDIYRLTLDGETEEYNFSSLPNGTTNLPVSVSYQTEQGAPATASGTVLLYQQPYSLVTGVTWAQDSGDEFENDELNVFYSFLALGFRTPGSAFTDLIAQNAIFDYKGVAFDGNEEATLNYRILFGTRVGHGTIAGFTRTGLINLWPAQLTNDWMIRGEAHMEKELDGEPFINYELAIFGPNAEEIVGGVYDPADEKGLLGDSEIIFAGKR